LPTLVQNPLTANDIANPTGLDSWQKKGKKARENKNKKNNPDWELNSLSRGPIPTWWFIMKVTNFIHTNRWFGSRLTE
jgi:hypothetical protein